MDSHIIVTRWSRGMDCGAGCYLRVLYYYVKCLRFSCPLIKGEIIGEEHTTIYLLIDVQVHLELAKTPGNSFVFSLCQQLIRINSFTILFNIRQVVNTWDCRRRRRDQYRYATSAGSSSLSWSDQLPVDFFISILKQYTEVILNIKRLLRFDARIFRTVIWWVQRHRQIDHLNLQVRNTFCETKNDFDFSPLSILISTQIKTQFNTLISMFIYFIVKWSSIYPRDKKYS